MSVEHMALGAFLAVFILTVVELPFTIYLAANNTQVRYGPLHVLWGMFVMVVSGFGAVIIRWMLIP